MRERERWEFGKGDFPSARLSSRTSREELLKRQYRKPGDMKRGGILSSKKGKRFYAEKGAAPFHREEGAKKREGAPIKGTLTSAR